MRWLELSLAAYLGAVLIVAGMAKIVDQRLPASMRAAVPNPWTGRNIPRGIILSLAITEVVTGLCLTAGSQIFIVSLGVGVLFLGFVVSEILLFLRYRNIECGCYGTAITSKVNLSSITVVLIQFILAAIHYYLVANRIVWPPDLLRLSIDCASILFIAFVLVQQFRYLLTLRWAAQVTERNTP